MASLITFNSDCKTEFDCYESIVKTLQSTTQEAVDKAQQIYDKALEDFVWPSPMGNIGCSFRTYQRSEENNYAVAAKKAIEIARAALLK